jgi:SPASM domain peptide maturase of grasp-with-spasm system
VKGASRSVLIDYARGSVYYLPNEYYDLLQCLDRKPVHSIVSQFEEADSLNNFYEFISFLKNEELAFFTDDPTLFPPRSDDYREAPSSLDDMIIELNPVVFDEYTLGEVCRQLNELRCSDVQIRVLSAPDFGYLAQVLKAFNATNINYLELHLSEYEASEMHLIWNLVERIAKLNAVYLYQASKPEVLTVTADTSSPMALHLGYVYCIDYPFENGNCCGIINHKTLSYNSVNEHNRLRIRNGCLDKKITIDRKGNIRNCPSMREQYGNIKHTTLHQVMQEQAFRKYWHVTKDQIDICRSCEFRYNCSDCRAFLTDPDNLYSKPAKCGYNPFTGEWEEGSSNPLKETLALHQRRRNEGALEKESFVNG